MVTAIRIKDLSKQYRLGQVGTGTISHDLNRWWAKFRGKDDPYSTVGQTNRRDRAADGDYVWALKDIDLEVNEGEVLGIIGANGAGKSTLLKLISRITSPTTGTVSIRGRIASLLEVGTGMHPEMTARENVYLNGAILGMRRREITRKFDEIIDFAGCRMYVDTPVKRFSSGMKVRLGFAVAAFLEPEVLIVDEVLAVGDLKFQQSCVGKMKDVSRSGKTILFVSHNMVSVQSLCTRGVVLEEGGVAFNGTVNDAVARYMSNAIQSVHLRDWSEGLGTEELRITKIYIRDALESNNALSIHHPFELVTEYEANCHDSKLHVTYHMSNHQGAVVCSLFGDAEYHEHGRYRRTCVIPGELLNTGVYRLDVHVVKDGSTKIFQEQDVFSFELFDHEARTSGYTGREPGVIRPVFKWSFERITDDEG